MERILKKDIIQYNRVGAILKNYIDLEMEGVIINPPAKSPILCSDEIMSYSYILSKKDNINNQIYFYIRENQENGKIDLRMKMFGNGSRREENRYNINGRELKKLMLEMWFEINTVIDFNEKMNEDIFINHIAINEEQPTGFGKLPF